LSEVKLGLGASSSSDDGTTITIGLKNTLPIEPYANVAPFLSATRKLREGETLQSAAKSLYTELLPVYGMLVLHEISNFRTGKEMGFGEMAAGLLGMFHGAENLKQEPPT
jgi:hypothetical protein